MEIKNYTSFSAYIDPSYNTPSYKIWYMVDDLFIISL